MDKYTEILNKVKEYISDEDNPLVTEGKISLYDLYHLLNTEIKKLYKEQESMELLEKINQENTFVKKVGRFFRKKEIRESLIDFESVLLTYDEKSTGIVFFDSDREQFCIEKDLDSNELYIPYGKSTDLQKEILNNHYDEIVDILNSLQEYRDLTGISNNLSSRCVEQNFTDGFMSVCISYNYFGRVNVRVNINKKVDINDVSCREYVRRDKIQNILDENIPVILKKFVVDYDSLDSGCIKILKRGSLDK
jgi:hypothetical protein